MRFELTVPCGTPVFKTGALNHYATPPYSAFGYYQKSRFYASIFLMTTGRLLGIDYGKKRIGIAISDENQSLAFPKEIVPNDKSTFERIGEILKTEDICEIVMGDSVDFSGKLNTVSAEIEVFISELKEKFNLPVHKEKEFLTSVEARKAGNNKASFQKTEAHSKMKKNKVEKVDAGAAALILQRYLDRKNKGN